MTALRLDLRESVRTGLPILEEQARAEDAANAPLRGLRYAPRGLDISAGAAMRDLTRRVAQFDAMLNACDFTAGT